MEKRGNMRNSKAVIEMIICEQEFRRAIQAILVEELQLPMWDIAKAEGRVVQQMKLPPRDRKELERYLRIADDFADNHRYKTLSVTTLHCFSGGIIPQAWDQDSGGPWKIRRPLECSRDLFPPSNRSSHHTIKCLQSGSSCFYWSAIDTILGAHALLSKAMGA